MRVASLLRHVMTLFVVISTNTSFFRERQLYEAVVGFFRVIFVGSYVTVFIAAAHVHFVCCTLFLFSRVAVVMTARFHFIFSTHNHHQSRHLWRRPSWLSCLCAHGAGPLRPRFRVRVPRALTAVLLARVLTAAVPFSASCALCDGTSRSRLRMLAR